MKKKLPTLTNDADAEAFVATADLTKYDLSEMKRLHFEKCVTGKKDNEKDGSPRRLSLINE